MDRYRLIELLTKRESGIITLPEARELNEYLENNLTDQGIAVSLKDVLSGTFQIQSGYSKQDINDRLKKLHSNLTDDTVTGLEIIKGGRSNFKIFIRSAAAVLILAFGVSFFFLLSRHNKNAAVPQNILATKKGSRSSLVLPDGTKVQLNADTRLIYDQSFGKKLREVTLEGEAYFEVVKDSEHPFIVHTKMMNVKVLGTVFNVRAYSTEKNTQATLLRGSVEVSLNKEHEKNIVVLKPNEKIVVKNYDANVLHQNLANKPEADILIMPVKTNTEEFSSPETGWTKNRLVFDQDSYSDVFAELERWYGVNVIIKDSSILNRKISSTYENESLTEVLESLKLATGFKYKIEENNLLIYK